MLQRLTSLTLFISCILGIMTAPAKASHRVITFIGDSTAAAAYSPPGYPKLIGEELGLPIHNLVIKYPPNYNTLQALHEEVPMIPPDTTDVVLAVGADDLLSIALGDNASRAKLPFTTLAAVERANSAIISALKARHLRIYELTIRDYSKDPGYRWKPGMDEAIQRIHEICDALNDFELDTPGVTVIDIRKYPDLIDNALYSDGVHLTENGVKYFARRLSTFLRDDS